MTTGGGGDGGDRLSELSDDLLRRILYFVPSKEAARTSVLSRRWGSLWRSSGAVNLAVQVHGYQHLQYGDSYQETEEAFFLKQEAFVRGAKAALDAAETPITKLTLRVESNDHDAMRTIDQFLCSGRDWERADLVGAVVFHQAARRVEELRVAVAAVDVGSFFLYYEEENHRHRGIYRLASLPSSDTLRVLDLTWCDLTLMAAAAFPLPRLSTLRLSYCSVYPNVVQALLDAATELATVQLESLYFVSPPDSQQKTQFHWQQQHHDELELDEAVSEPPVLRLSFPAATTTLVLALCGMPPESSEDRRGRSRGAQAPSRSMRPGCNPSNTRVSFDDSLYDPRHLALQGWTCISSGITTAPTTGMTVTTTMRKRQHACSSGSSCTASPMPGPSSSS